MSGKTPDGAVFLSAAEAERLKAMVAQVIDANPGSIADVLALGEMCCRYMGDTPEELASTYILEVPRFGFDAPAGIAPIEQCILILGFYTLGHRARNADRTWRKPPMYQPVCAWSLRCRRNEPAQT